MIDSLQTKQIVEQSVQELGSAQKAEPSVPDEQDVERFGAAMEEQGPSAAALETPRSASVDQVEPTSQGDKILQSLDAQRGVLQGRLGEIEAVMGGALEGKEVSPTELLSLQWKLQQSVLELEIATKVVEKSNEGVSTLLKNQG